MPEQRKSKVAAAGFELFELFHFPPNEIFSSQCGFRPGSELSALRPVRWYEKIPNRIWFVSARKPTAQLCGRNFRMGSSLSNPIRIIMKYPLEKLMFINRVE